jgi:hypothetical protein
MARFLLTTLALLAIALLGTWRPTGLDRQPATTPPSRGQWEPDRRASQENLGSGQDETAIAVNPLNPNNAIVVTRDFRGEVRNYLDATTDGGLTWVEQPFPLNAARPLNIDPAVIFRRDGRAYIFWTTFSDFFHGGISTASSDDGGITWSPEVPVTPPDGHFDDKAWAVFDETGGPHDGTLHVAWTRFGDAEIFAARSSDGGSTWSVPVPVSTGAYRSPNDGAQPVALADGTLLVVFMHDVSAQVGTLVAARSTDGGATFSANQPLFSISKPPFMLPGEQWRIFTYHSLAYDTARGWLTLVWPDYRNGPANGIDILSSRSTDAGATWTPPARLNDDPSGVLRDQFFPSVAAATDGRLTAIWLDRRDDPANRLYHAYARTSTDGGLLWLPSVRVSSAPSDPNLNIPEGADGIGDYIGIGAGPGVFWGAWTDVRNFNQDIYAARELFTPQPTPTRTHTPLATATTQTSPTVTPCPIYFSDVRPSDYFYDAVRYLYCAGAISGYSDGTFRPYNYTTRGQLCKIVVLAEGWPINTPPQPTFTDVPTSNPFYPYIETAHSHGIISGYSDGTFRWANNITRGQLCKIVVIAEGWPLYMPPFPSFTDVPANDPFYPYIETAHSRGIISGYADRTFRPYNPAIRAQIARIIYNALD